MGVYEWRRLNCSLVKRIMIAKELTKFCNKVIIISMENELEERRIYI